MIEYFKYLFLFFSSKKDEEDRVNLNNLHIAKAALFCEAQFMAILYGELATYDNENDMNPEIKSILKNAYKSIGENDAVSAFLDPITNRTEYLEFNKCWTEIFIRHDAHNSNFESYTSYLTQAGLYNLSNKLNQKGSSTNYECAWRLSDWGIVDAGNEKSTQTIQQNNEFDKHHYFALKCLQQRDEVGVRSNIHKAIEGIIKNFKQSSFEVTNNIYKSLMMLQMLQQIEEFCDVREALIILLQFHVDNF